MRNSEFAETNFRYLFTYFGPNLTNKFNTDLVMASKFVDCLKKLLIYDIIWP